MIKMDRPGNAELVMSGAQPALASMFFSGPAAEEACAPSLARADERRFRQIVVANLDFIWRCLRRMGIPSGDVDDAAQQVFLVVAAKLGSIAQGSERAFLFATASRIAANSRRSVHRRDEAHHQLMQAECSRDPSQEELTDQLRARALMDRVLAEMPSDLREVFVLFELEELSVAEVADLLSIPIGTVGSRLRRAREDFHERVLRIKATTQRGRK
jgi:RNA polymerase sigma-70 factor (ECF subfamily)